MKTNQLFENLNKDFSYELCTHVNPDLDAISSLLSLLDVMNAKGYKVAGNLQNEPLWMDFLGGWDLYHELKKKKTEPYHVICLDCGAMGRVWPENILVNASSIINIDHHFDNPLFGTINICDFEVSSTAELLFMLFENDQVTIHEKLASNLYAGILFDTGGFRYSNTTTKTFHNVSKLIALGVNPALVADKVFTNWDPKGFCALRLALNQIEYWEENKILFSYVSYDQISKNGLSNDDFEGVIDILRLNRDSRFTILVREIRKNYFKGSVRAKAPHEIGSSLKELNGGGHKRAAGFAIESDSIDSIKTILFNHLKQIL